MIQAQTFRGWGKAIVKGRAECLLALLERTVPNAPRSKVTLREVTGSADTVGQHSSDFTRTLGWKWS